MIVTLTRFWMDSTRATLGAFFLDKDLICGSLELPWKGNQHNISCIPCGKYPCKWGAEIKRYRLSEVPERSGIEIHPGNTTHDTSGCILPGNLLKVTDEISVYESRLALERLRSLAGDSFLLIVTLDHNA